jgi:ribonucleoside-triphosphate reductase
MYKNIVKFPSAFSYLVYKRTYARRLNDYNNKTEEFKDTLDRIINGCRNQLKLNLNSEEEFSLRYNMSKFRCSVAGRYLWQLNTKTVDNNGFGSLMNCMFINIDDYKNFSKIFNWLMLGCGVGFSVERHNINKLPKIINKDINIIHNNKDDNAFIVKDSREGWVELLDKILNSYFISGESFNYNTSYIRKKGVPIGFGGVSSGDEELIKMVSEINNIMIRNKNNNLKDIDCLDIVACIASCVVSGNVRRSALISIGDNNSETYLRAKRWSNGNIPNYRAFVNMTVKCDDFNDIYYNDEFWHNYLDGEPFGFYNQKLANSCGRIGDTKYKDVSEGMNPCGEMNLASGETCNLAELNLPSFNSYDEIKNIAIILYKICKHAYILDCHDKETEKICRENWRMGISVTGYLSSTEEQKQWLPELYNDLREFDILYTGIMGELHPEYNMKESIKITTIKPSGTLSSMFNQLCYGIHPAFSKYMIRRVRISPNHDLINICKNAGYKIYPEERFDGTFDNNTSIVEFYLKADDNAIIADDVDAIYQLETIKRLQKDWSDNSVSCTIYFTPEELPKIKEYLKNNYNNNFKSLSFLLKYDHGFKNAPLEKITKEQYEEYIKDVKDINLSYLGETTEEELYNNNVECVNGVCPVR